MAKRLFLLFITALIGIIISPGFLADGDVFISRSSAISNAKTIEKMVAPERSTEEIADHMVGATKVSHTKSTSTASYAVASSNSISISGRTIPVIQSSDTGYVSDSVANRYGNKFIYAHNSANLFGVLFNSWVGQRFSVTIDGVTTNYIVAKIVVYEKNETKGLLQLNGKGNYMQSVANAIDKNIDASSQVTLNYYDLSLMTCCGTMLGGGRATHRLVIFAYAV
ncbi:hypothetical protein IJG89_00645 [Candidatus Saccharibacteria bacterium]|nr:hypothetical protein [Candidatus Saccharibacteria bacterium]